MPDIYLTPRYNFLLFCQVNLHTGPQRGNRRPGAKWSSRAPPPTFRLWPMCQKEFHSGLRPLRHFKECLRIRPLQSEAPQITRPWGNLFPLPPPPSLQACLDTTRMTGAYAPIASVQTWHCKCIMVLFSPQVSMSYNLFTQSQLMGVWAVVTPPKVSEKLENWRKKKQIVIQGKIW